MKIGTGIAVAGVAASIAAIIVSGHGADLMIVGPFAVLGLLIFMALS